jgi:hypothetical protein
LRRHPARWLPRAVVTASRQQPGHPEAAISLKVGCNRAARASRGSRPRSLGHRTYGYGSVGRCGRARDSRATSRFRYDVQSDRCSTSSSSHCRSGFHSSSRSHSSSSSDSSFHSHFAVQWLALAEAVAISLAEAAEATLAKAGVTGPSGAAPRTGPAPGSAEGAR